jgi:hypothetical protein
VKRRVILRTDRRIVLRTRADKIPWIELRSWLMRLLRASFFCGMLPIRNNGQKTGILIVVVVLEPGLNRVLKRFRMWHPPLLKSFTRIRGGMDATIEAFALG